MKKVDRFVFRAAMAAAFAFAAATYAHDEPRAPQRAAANAFERSGGSSASAGTSGEVARSMNTPGKHAAQMVESRRASAASSGIDLAHAPRPVTASKNADLDEKWRENARQFQVAPVK